MRVVVIGGVAAGMSAASQAKRRMKEAEVIVLEKTGDVSYGSCGMPYNLMRLDNPMDELVVLTADDFRNKRGIDVRLFQEARRIDREKKEVEVWDSRENRIYNIGYDKLVIATGARAINLPMEKQINGVFTLRTLEDGKRLKNFIKERKPKKAFLIGAGRIALEIVHALHELEMSIVMVKKRPGRILPQFEEEISEKVEAKLREKGINFISGVEIKGFMEKDGFLKKVVTSEGEFEAELSVISIGVQPNIEVAEKAGIKIGETGAIEVDRYLRTSDRDIFACGDCCEHYHRLLKKPVFSPSGTVANKQGRIAGANAIGANIIYPGVVGTSIFSFFDLTVARTGLVKEEIKEDFVKTVILSQTRGHAYPGSSPIKIVLFSERGTGRLLGAQMIGKEYVWGRINVVAACLYKDFTVDDLSSLDMAYSPPFSPVWDPLLIAANRAKKSI
ncbi:MAG: FAD-dependent oxidoreductase [Deltaproteobacteria bacterium]|nr:FAD-dependent oxidoreductase [Deltaproteobacteria bacterium]